jgi:hypothetical protein
MRALALKLLADRVKQADTANRSAITSAFKIKDREVAWLPLNGQDVEIGQVRRDQGTVGATVTNMGELLGWVEANYPTEVEEYTPAAYTRIRPSFLAALLADAKSNKAPVDRNGEVIPGIDVAVGDPKTVVVAAKTPEAEAALMAAIVADPGALSSLLAIEGGSDGV